MKNFPIYAEEDRGYSWTRMSNIAKINNIYVDSIVENVKVCDEQSALNQMIDRSEIKTAIILERFS